MSKSEKSVRQQLLEAQANIQRQIDILQAGPLVNYRGGGMPFDPAIAGLMATLKKIDDSLADLGKDET